jgi:hypothetical protein
VGVDGVEQIVAAVAAVHVTDHSVYLIRVCGWIHVGVNR